MKKPSMKNILMKRSVWNRYIPKVNDDTKGTILDWMFILEKSTSKEIADIKTEGDV